MRSRRIFDLVWMVRHGRLLHRARALTTFPGQVPAGEAGGGPWLDILCRTFSPLDSLGDPTWAFGPGWYIAGLWPLASWRSFTSCHIVISGAVRNGRRQPNHRDESAMNCGTGCVAAERQYGDSGLRPE